MNIEAVLRGLENAPRALISFGTAAFQGASKTILSFGGTPARIVMALTNVPESGSTAVIVEITDAELRRNHVLRHLKQYLRGQLNVDTTRVALEINRKDLLAILNGLAEDKILVSWTEGNGKGNVADRDSLIVTDGDTVVALAAGIRNTGTLLSSTQNASAEGGTEAVYDIEL